MLKMFFIPLMLLLAMSPIESTFPELPDVNSFIPSLFEMVPVNGQLRVNDQIFNFGSTTTASTDIPTDNQEEPRVDPPQTSNSLPQTPDVESRATDDMPRLPSVSPQPQNNGPVVEQNFDSRAQNQLPQPIADSFPQSFPTNPSSPSNFETRIPSLDSILSNLRTPQNSVVNSLPNIGSTEMGSTFARNANSDFRDEFSQPRASTPVPFGLPGRIAGGEVRSNLASTESPLVVMPLVVSPQRLMQRNGMSSNPLPIPALFAPFNENERMSASERIESLPVSPESMFSERTTNGTTNGSEEVVSRQSTIIVPPSTFRQLTDESSPKQHNLDAELDRHVLSILRKSNSSERSATSPLSFGFDSLQTTTNSPQEVPTSTQVEQ